jgi:glucose 1-dehydrogenase
MADQRVALVTGANTGIGWAIAQRLQRDGLALGFHTHREDDEARKQFDEIVSAGAAHWISGDVADPAVPERLVSETVDALGRLDVLVNNAGISTAKPALELTAEDFDSIFNIDVKGSFLLAVAAAHEMRNRAAGVIVNVTSVHEHVPRPGFALYAAAKAALGMLTRGLALELAQDGIRVNAVAPGAIATERNEEAGELETEIPLGRAGTPDEVAAVVSFLVREEASYVSGASVLVDGGMAQHVLTEPAW